MHHFRLTPVYVAILSALLAGCMGGGSSPAIRRILDPSPPPPSQSTNPDRITISGGASVTVAVVDSGARLTHNEFSGGVVSSTYNAIDGSSNVNDADSQFHGTAMASIVAGKTQGYSGNAKLMIVKGMDVAGGSVLTLANGVSYAAQNGARVINSSNSGWQVSHPDAIAPYQSIVTYDSLWVNAAGNGGLNITDVRVPSAFFFESRTDLADIRNRMLVVGRLNEAETARDTDSDYPGGNTLLQERFVLAPGTTIGAAHGTGDSTYRQVDGTSPAAAVASGVAASIISKWPHLTAPQTASIILDTARRSDPLYSQNTCGGSGTMNCGAFYMGRGILDPVAALNPVGTLSMALSDEVAGPSVPVARTGLAASMAFGDAFDGLSRLPVASFDAYGRDYLVTLRMAPAQTALARFGGLGSSMLRGHTEYQRVSDEFGNSQESFVRMNADGSAAAAMSFQTGDTKVTGYRFGFGESNPAAMPDGLTSLHLLSYNGNGAIASDYLAVSGVSGEVASGIEHLTFGFDVWRANNTVSGLDGGDQSATRTEVTLRYVPADWMRLSAGIASLIEREAMLGTKATGALQFRDGTPFVSQTIGLDILPLPGATMFARYESGAMSNVGGAGLIDSVTNIRASQFAIGATYETEGLHAALVGSSPLRVDSGVAHLSVPTGRTIDGKVLRTAFSSELAPSGRERSIEFALATHVGKTAVVQINLSRTVDPGHNAQADAENMVALGYRTRF